jgi:hypothetical protein
VSSRACAKRATAQIIPFPSDRQPRNRFSPRDRIAVIRWTEQASRRARVRVEIHEDPGNAPDLGDFLLIYREGATWAAWAVACGRGCYSVWQPSSGATLGDFPSMRAALEAILPSH